MSPTTVPIGPPCTLSQFVLKVHGRCDLACDHCYVYEHADQSWRRKPRAMAPETVRATAARIAEHARTHRLRRVRIVLHGGEPLLLGAAGLAAVIAALRAGIEPVARIDFRMQTNGVLLTPEICDVLLDAGVKIGISFDGDRIANDRHRLFPTGASSYDAVRRALALLRTERYRDLYAGILATIDVRNDPIAVYEALLAEHPPRIDFLLPHATWDQPPLRPGADPTPYATWLGAIHARWSNDGEPMRIRMFDALQSTASGGRSGTEQFGTDPVDLAVIDTGGEWEQVDSLKTAYDGAAATGMSVFTHSADDVAALPEIAVRQRGIAGLSDTCRACPVVGQCGGGLYAHRYRAGHGFDNPSVYCADLKELVRIVNSQSMLEVKDGTQALPDGVLDEIAAGTGSETVLRWLADSEVTIARALTAAVGEGSRSHAYASEGRDVLAAAEIEDPDAVRTVLAHPYVRAWAVRSLRDPAAGAPDERGHLGAIAAAAAVRAGMSAEVTAPVRAGAVHLPTVGTAHLPSSGDGLATIVIRPGELTVRSAGATLAIDPGSGAEPRWQPARWFDVDGLSILLEDQDPYRDCHGWTPAPRLSADDADAWRVAVGQAWQVIRDEVPGYVPGLRAGLRTIVPLMGDPSGRMRASTARHAFGSVAAALADPAALAVMIVHEFQHGKLGALLDVCDLYDPTSSMRLQVGWRDDLRPIEGALQGTYAHLAVADVWRVRAAGGDGATEAAAHYRQYRDWTEAAIGALRDSGTLTPLGERFTDRMAATIASWSR